VIGLAEHFIYIENQYFISSVGSGPEFEIANGIGQAILNRISWAIRNKRKFKVVLVLPVHPEGEWRSQANQAIIYIQQSTLVRGIHSMINQLQNDYGDIKAEDYFSFYSVRNYAQMPDGTFATAQIYVHTKIMIVDDRYTIIGSANINDRSFLGDRDSELAILCENNPDIYPDGSEIIQLDGTDYRVSKYGHSLRMRLMNEHAGFPLDDTRLSDIISNLDEHWVELARSNTNIYETVFPKVPADRLQRIDQVDAEPAGPFHTELLSSIKGHLVRFPAYFLYQNEFPDFVSACPTNVEACSQLLV